jgi:hypothetical protein
MEYVLAPLAKTWGISKKKDITRFTEQGWVLAYYNVLWPLGMVRIPNPLSHGDLLFLVPILQIAIFSQYGWNVSQLARARTQWAHKGIHPLAVILLYTRSLRYQY